jgi:hypothetical protein
VENEGGREKIKTPTLSSKCDSSNSSQIKIGHRFFPA